MIKRFFDSIRYYYMNSSYQSKLVNTLFVITIIPIILLTSFSYYQNKVMIEEQSIALSRLYLEQVEGSINAELNKLINVARIISRDIAITDILEKDPLSTSIFEQIRDLRELDTIISSHISSPTIYNIRLYVNKDFIYSNRRVITYNLENIKDIDEPWAKSAFDNNGFISFTTPYEFTYPLDNSQRIVSVILPIRSSENFDKTIGVITVDMLEEYLLELMKVADYTSKGEVYITNSNYEPIIIYTTASNPIFDNLDSIGDENSGISVSVFDGHIVGSTSLMNTWNLITIASMEDLLATQSNLKLQFSIMNLILGLGIYFLAHIYGKHNARRINSLAKQIQVIESGNFDVCCIVDSADEIGDLQTSFNYMARKINFLMKEQYDLGKNLNDMELKVLQAQINPHFLYNTLDLISWTAQRNDMDAVCDIVLKLSKFYRISLNNGSDYITISDEIEHVNLYTQLQNHRLAQKIELTAEIDKDLENYKIMKLLLQPIVENSIIHGITNSDKLKGEIHISVVLQNGIIRISVADNGIGMNQSTINRLMTFDEIHNSSEYSGGYGLKNVIKRLKLYYNYQADITFESKHNIGTNVIITLPYN